VTDVRIYPQGVPSWIDTEQPDLRAAQEFYGGLFGWTFETVTPPGAPAYVIARLDGREAAGLAQGDPDAVGATSVAAWNTYVAVDDAGAVVERVRAAGGRVVSEPQDAGDSGRSAACLDPSGAGFRLWQARRRPGVQSVNVPGAWNFSDLHTGDRASAVAFYSAVFGWVFDDVGSATMVRVPGYGDHLEATVDPDIRARQAGALVPPGFADAVGWLGDAEPGSSSHWHVSFTVAERDATVATAEKLGAGVLDVQDTQWTRTALIRDPQGAQFTASQFTPPA
jgi:predicted enzyme related to lactoylglutathione lyase